MNQANLLSRLILALIFLLSAAGLYWYLDGDYTSPEVVSHEEMHSEYNSSLNIVLEEYSNNIAAVGTEDMLSITTQTIGSLVELRVPAASKDSHLDIVLALNKLQTALMQSDSDMINLALTNYNELVSSYPIQLEEL